MKYIIAVIQPDRIYNVLDELERRGIHLVTVTPVMGRGRQHGQAEVYRGHKEVGSLLQKMKLEIAVNDEFLETAMEGIAQSAKTEAIGDGKIFVLDLEQVLRIRTDEKGPVAIG